MDIQTGLLFRRIPTPANFSTAELTGGAPIPPSAPCEIFEFVASGAVIAVGGA